jgi:uncharacterized protein YoxC
MTTVFLITIIILQIISLIIFFWKKTPSLDLLKKDIILLEKDLEVIRSQVILIITKSNLDSNRISSLEAISLKLAKQNKTDNNFH